MEIKVFTNKLQNEANAYLVYDKKLNQTILIDTASLSDEIIEFAEQNELVIGHIFLTHTHIRHIRGLEKILKKFNSIVHLCFNDIDGLFENEVNGSSKTDEIWQLSTDYLANVKSFLFKVDVKVDNLDVTVIPTGGHSKGSAMYYVQDYKLLFTGDNLFAKGILEEFKPDYLNEESWLDNSATKTILTEYDGDILVYPGHFNSIVPLKNILEMESVKKLIS